MDRRGFLRLFASVSAAAVVLPLPELLDDKHRVYSFPSEIKLYNPQEIATLADLKEAWLQFGLPLHLRVGAQIWLVK